MNKFSGESGTILIVDDQKANIEVIGTMLSTFGYDLMIAQDGEQAIKRAKAKAPDLVLLDILMPGMSGFDVCRAYHEMEEMEGVPIIFLSADNDKNTIVKALEMGGIDYITKPFNKAELIARVRCHLELKRTREECQALLRNTERFLEIMAHDLRNWVGSSNFSALLLAELDEMPETGKRLASIIKDSTGQALNFIDEYLANARESHANLDLDRRMFDLKSLVETNIQMHQAEAQSKQITLCLNSGIDDVRVKSDRGAVMRVIENLITNAIKFSPHGATVTVALEGHPISLRVTDEGPGFSDEDRNQLFEPYTRLSARPTAGEVSTGLGLSIIKRLCDQLEIEIEVESPEYGAMVRLIFPHG